ncbi:MAG: hypothetical protein FWH51_02055 [Dehalococcoidia bacterium]|nr:hypothetical protein [Dehalococcoidia bacterium]
MIAGIKKGFSYIKKGFIGYIFLLVLGIACIATGASAFGINVPSAIFSILVGLALLGIGVVMARRKD